MLEFGVGQSTIPDQLREKYKAKVIAVDIIPPVNPHPDRLTGDIMDLKLSGNQFDLVYSLQVLEHIPEPVPVIHELYRLVKPGGYLYIHTDMHQDRDKDFFNWYYTVPPDHCSYYKPDTFEYILRNQNKAFITIKSKYVLIQKF